MERYDSRELLDHGIVLPRPELVTVGREVALERLGAGVVLHPGVRIEGSRTILAENCVVGADGPVVLRDAALGPHASVARGSAESCVLLDWASLGPDCHVRGGTLLEEGASTAHGCGLKQTILTAFATLGSQINFCDCLLTGGRSREDHSEVGSGFIHFNFTPFGPRGDKATPSLFGDVPRGVLLDCDRIFLGGSAGVVGPVKIGFGTILAAGSVYRRDHPDGRLVLGEDVAIRSVAIDARRSRGARRRYERSIAFVGQIRALQAWYRTVRIPRTTGLARAVCERAVDLLDAAVAERVRQIDRLLDAPDADQGLVAAWDRRRADLLRAPEHAPPPSELTDAVRDGGGSHVEWVRGLLEPARASVRSWLESIAAAFAV